MIRLNWGHTLELKTDLWFNATQRTLSVYINTTPQWKVLSITQQTNSILSKHEYNLPKHLTLTTVLQDSI